MKKNIRRISPIIERPLNEVLSLKYWEFIINLWIPVKLRNIRLKWFDERLQVWQLIHNLDWNRQTWVEVTCKVIFSWGKFTKIDREWRIGYLKSHQATWGGRQIARGSHIYTSVWADRRSFWSWQIAVVTTRIFQSCRLYVCVVLGF